MKRITNIFCISILLLTYTYVINAGEAKQLSDEDKKMAESFAAAVLKDSGDADEVDCDRAVFNAKDSIDTMLSVGEKNYKDGYIEKSEYTKMSKALNKINRQISKSECLRSKGKTKSFYKCMTNNLNHIATCGKKYNYGS